MNKYFLCFLGLATAIFSKSQDLPLPEGLEQNFVFAQDSKGVPSLITNKEIYRLENKWIKTPFTNTINNKDSLVLFFPERQFNSQNYTSLLINNQLHFVLSGGGFVLKLLNNGLTRIDNSVIQKTHFGSAIFVHDGQIHKYGGYGLWEFKDYTTYFNSLTGSWEYLNSNSTENPQGRWKSLFHKIENKLFVLGGRANESQIKKMSDAIVQDFFIYDLSLKTFQHKGALNNNLPLKASKERGFIFKNKKAYASENELIIIDFLKEEMTQINSKNLFQNLDKNHVVFESKDTLFYITNKNNQKFLSRLPVLDMGSLPTKTFPLKSKENLKNLYWIAIAGLVTLFLVWVLFGLYRYKDFLRQLILFDKNRLYLGQKSVMISVEQLVVIETLNAKGSLTAEELNKIVSSNKKFVKSHLVLLRKTFIEKINQAFEKLTKFKKPLILEEKDPRDKRYLVYRATQEVFKKPSFWDFLIKR